jgi:hypothetical protein
MEKGCPATGSLFDSWQLVAVPARRSQGTLGFAGAGAASSSCRRL